MFKTYIDYMFMFVSWLYRWEKWYDTETTNCRLKKQRKLPKWNVRFGCRGNWKTYKIQKRGKQFSTGKHHFMRREVRLKTNITFLIMLTFVLDQTVTAHLYVIFKMIYWLFIFIKSKKHTKQDIYIHMCISTYGNFTSNTYIARYHFNDVLLFDMFCKCELGIDGVFLNI